MSSEVVETGAAAVEERSFWALLREAVRGSEQDYTRGSLNRAVFLLAVPMVLEMLMESVFGILDVFFVGRLGADAVAAVGLTEALLTVLFSLALGISMSTTAVVARRIGEKDQDRAARTAIQAVLLGIVMSLPFALAGIVWPRELLRLMGAPEAVVATGWAYTAWMLGGGASILLLFLINAVFRGAGDASVAMRSLWLANGVNIVLDPLLIFGLGPFPELGVTGAAIGTTIGRSAGVLYQLYELARSPRLRIARRHLRLEPTLLAHLLRVSVGGTAQFLIATASWLALVRILTPFGAAPLAGYTIALRVVMVTLLPAWGLSNAVATLVGQNLGAGAPERAERSVWITGFYNMGFLLLVMAAFLAWGEPIVAVFSADAEVQQLGALCLRVFSYGYAFYAWGMVLLQAFNGAGDTATPSWINVFCYWLFQIPVAFVMAQGLDLGPLGVFLAITVTESLVTVVSFVVFRRGRWKATRV